MSGRTEAATQGYHGIRVAAGLLVAGLAVEGATLFTPGALSFLSFALVGGVLVAAGVVTYLGVLLSR